MEESTYSEHYDPTQKRLTIGGARMFPPRILEHAHEVEILDMSHGELTHLAYDFAQLTKLKRVFFSHNPLTELHPLLLTCTNLTMLGLKSCRITRIDEDVLPIGLSWLILTDNQLTELPASIGQLTQLRKLSLAGNQLTQLPTEMEACQNLEFIRLGANNFDSPPDWVLGLPRLAWYGGVQRQLAEENEEDITEISYDDIVFGELIGSSPTSEVWSGVLRSTNEAVAVKIYRSHLTSDGWPEDDVRMSVSAGEHPNLIPALGKLVGHPEEKQGMVLALIPPHFQSLGLPPNLESCTRDTFREGTSWTLPFIRNVLTGVASACAQLHERGIIHGDLYAHNILVNEDGGCYLGDFGGASRYDKSDQRFEQIEVRAFGYLTEDLLDHCVEQSSELEQLKNDCLNLDINERPLFSEIVSRLNGLVVKN